MNPIHRPLLLWSTFLALGLALLVPGRAEAGKPIQLATEKRELYNPVASPDGRYLIFDARVPGKTEREVTVVVLGSKPIKRRFSRGTGAAFSPDSEQVVFYSAARDDNRYWVATAGTPFGRSEKIYDIEGIDPSAARALYSPDGTQVLVTNRTGTWLLTLANGDVRQLTTTVLTAPHWHPSEPRVVFERRGGGISVLDVNSGQTEKITGNGAGHKPRWSPDGKRLVFMHELEIYTWDMETRDRKKIAPGVEARWSNSGLGLIILAETGSFTQGESFELADMRLSWVPLQGDAQPQVLMEKAHGVAVGPDGRTLFAVVHKEGAWQMKVDSIEGEDAARKALETGAATPPAGQEAPAGDQSGERRPPVKRPDRPIDPDVLKAVQ